MTHSYMTISLWLWWMWYALGSDQGTLRGINESVLWPRSVLLWLMNIEITRVHFIRKTSCSITLCYRKVKKHTGSYNLGGLRTKSIDIKSYNLHSLNIVCASLHLCHWIAVRLFRICWLICSIISLCNQQYVFQKRLPFLHSCLHYEKVREEMTYH